MTDATLGASGLWLGTRTGAGGTTTLAKVTYNFEIRQVQKQQETSYPRVTYNVEIRQVQQQRETLYPQVMCNVEIRQA